MLNLKGKLMLDHLNKCLPRFLEKNYKSSKALNCNKLGTTAFKAQGRCYLEILDIFCTAFPENKELLVKVLDRGDFLNLDSINMISKVADKCNPKLDLTSFMFSSGQNRYLEYLQNKNHLFIDSAIYLINKNLNFFF